MEAQKCWEKDFNCYEEALISATSKSFCCHILVSGGNTVPFFSFFFFAAKIDTHNRFNCEEGGPDHNKLVFICRSQSVDASCLSCAPI